METAPSRDQGPHPYVVDIEEATLGNANFRTTLWTGPHLQMTVMSIESGDDIGLEVHPHGDQFLRVEQGRARVQMGQSREDLDFDQTVGDDWVILVPAGSWHNITNVGDAPLKLYVLYAPPEHEFGTVHTDKSAAEADHDH